MGEPTEASEKAIHSALPASDAMYRALVEASASTIWTTNARGEMLADSPSWREYTGQTVQEWLGSGWLDAVHPDERALSGSRWRTAVVAQHTVDSEIRLKHAASGTWRLTRVRAVPVRDEAGQVQLWVGMNVDIEDARQAEAALRESEARLLHLNETLEHRVDERTAQLDQAREALRQSQKLESMGQLTGGVAHDVNNLLTPITGALDWLQRKELGGDREQRLIDGALQSADRIKILVQRLLAFARRQPLKAIAVDVAEVVKGMAALIESTTGPHIRVVVDMASDLPLAHADANQIEMAILNLCVNARDAMATGGMLRIAASGQEVTDGQNDGLPCGRYLNVSVEDTGCGMDADTLARAIEPFFSTKRPGEGTGLGLSMVHGLAAQLGGALRISSTVGLGTRMELLLPESAAAVDVLVVEDDAHRRPLTGTVLLVDDEDLARASTSAMLADLGYVVIEAGSAREALAAIGQGVSFDLLVTDRLMPDMDGTELIREIAEHYPEVPALMISGYVDIAKVEQSFAILEKPFRHVDLAKAVAKIQPPCYRDGRNGAVFGDHNPPV